MIELYHYIHCPFCVRVRMAFGALSVSYKSLPLPYNEEKSLIEMTGTKMLPIVKWQDGSAQNESLDIIKKLDSENKLKLDVLDNQERVDELNNLLDRLGSPIHNLVMPYWIYTQEFDETSREYFQKKKEVKRGPFKDLMKNKKDFLKILAKEIMSFQNYLGPFYKSETLTIQDIMIASHLWGLYVLPEFQFPLKVHEYLQRVKQETKFDYHEDFFKDSNIREF
tara:strand:- start:33165 stop:33833 length:669 start_codon:yes stop_codon:yes gene_type:complete